MTCEHRLFRSRAEPCRAQGSGGGGKAVDQHRDAAERAAEIDAAQARKVKAAELGEHVQRVARVGAVDLDAAADRPELAPQPLVRKARAAPRHLFGLDARQHRRDGGGGRRVADAHLPGGQQARPALGLRVHELHAREDRRLRLLKRHGGACCEVRRAVADAAIQHARKAGKVPDAQIRGHDAAVGARSHPAHGGAPQRELARNRRRHLAPRLGHALCRHAVVRAEHQRRARLERDVRAAGQGRDIADRILQQTEAAERLGAGVPTPPGFRARRFVRRGDGFNKFT